MKKLLKAPEGSAQQGFHLVSFGQDENLVIVGSASFVCKNCNHELPKTFSVKTDQYCYLCDPKVTLEECLQKDYPKTWKK